MPRFRYEIRPVPAGWEVVCNDVAGPPYAERDAAVLDTLTAAEQLQRDGHAVDVRLFDLNGIGQVLQPADARLFSA